MKRILLFLVLIMFCGCSYREINDLAIANALGIDYYDGKYHVSAEIMKLEKEGEDSKQKSVLYEGEGESLASAIRNVSLKYPKVLYLGHLELVVFGKGVLDIGIDKTFDYFLRSPETRADIIVLTSTKYDAKDIINPENAQQNSFPSKDLLTTVKYSMQRNGKSVNLNLEEIISTYLKTGIDMVITDSTINEDDKLKTDITGIVAFKDNKLLPLLSDQASIAYNTLNENYYDIVIPILFKEKYVDIAIFNPSSSIKVDIKDKINLNIDIKIYAHTLLITDKVDLRNEKILTQLESITEKELKTYILDLLDYCKSNNTDILGIKNYVYKHYYKEYNKYKDKNLYEIVNTNLNIDVKLYRFGNTYKGV